MSSFISDKVIPKNIGLIILIIRKEKEILQKDLKESSKVSNLSKIETGKEMPNEKQLERIAKALGESTTSLIEACKKSNNQLLRIGFSLHEDKEFTLPFFALLRTNVDLLFCEYGFVPIPFNSLEVRDGDTTFFKEMLNVIKENNPIKASRLMSLCMERKIDLFFASHIEGKESPFEGGVFTKMASIGYRKTINGQLCYSGYILSSRRRELEPGVLNFLAGLYSSILYSGINNLEGDYVLEDPCSRNLAELGLFNRENVKSTIFNVGMDLRLLR